jgi:hypothetical protein
MRSKAHTAFTVPLVLYCTRIVKCAMKTFGIKGQLRNKLFLTVIQRFSLVKAAMNAPCICILRNGVNKKPLFLLFSTAKGGKKDHCALVNCGGVEFLKLR